MCMPSLDTSCRIDLNMIRDTFAVLLRPTSPLLSFLQSAIINDSSPGSQSDSMTNFRLFEAIHQRQTEFDKSKLNCPFQSSKLQAKAPILYPHFAQNLEWALTCEALEPIGLQLKQQPPVNQTNIFDFLGKGKLPDRLVRGFAFTEAGIRQRQYVDVTVLEFDLFCRWAGYLERYTERMHGAEQKAQIKLMEEICELLEVA